MEVLQKKWFVVYTKPRWEKKVNALFMNKGMESYCPLNKVYRKWSDRTKVVEEPLFKSYVFVRIADVEQTRIRTTNGVLNFVYWNGKPAVVKDKEIEVIKRFLNEYENVEAVPLELYPSQKVVITGGVMMNREAKINRTLNNKKVEVEIEGLGYKLIAVVEKSKISSAKLLKFS